MIDRTLLAKVTSLSPAERLELIGTIWDSLPHAEIPITPGERAMLKSRIKDAEDNPGDESPWSEVRPRLQKPRG